MQESTPTQNPSQSYSSLICTLILSATVPLIALLPLAAIPFPLPTLQPVSLGGSRSITFGWPIRICLDVQNPHYANILGPVLVNLILCFIVALAISILLDALTRRCSAQYSTVRPFRQARATNLRCHGRIVRRNVTSHMGATARTTMVFLVSAFLWWEAIAYADALINLLCIRKESRVDELVIYGYGASLLCPLSFAYGVGVLAVLCHTAGLRALRTHLCVYVILLLAFLLFCYPAPFTTWFGRYYASISTLPL